jgi:hypothetical protein
MNNEGLSGYAKIIQTILTTSGPIALIALALVAFLMYSVRIDLGRLDAGVRANQLEIQSAKVSMHAFVAQQIELDRVNANQLALLIKISQQSCLNSARSEIAVKGCLGER